MPWLDDIRQSQTPNGAIPDVAPVTELLQEYDLASCYLLLADINIPSVAING